MLKAMAHSLRRLRHQVNKEERAIEVGRTKLARLCSRSTNHISDRQLYFKDLCGLAMAW